MTIGAVSHSKNGIQNLEFEQQMTFQQDSNFFESIKVRIRIQTEIRIRIRIQLRARILFYILGFVRYISRMGSEIS